MNEAMLRRDAIDRWTAERRPEFEEMLRQYVEVPSVSMDPGRVGDIRRLAEICADTFRRFGGQAEVHTTPGHPIVHARFESGPECPTVTVYNHMDVQPATEPEWKSDPFRFRIDGDRYLGRGTTDDKGPALSALFGARLALEAGVPVNIRFLWEFEEEIGSANFEGALKDHAADIHTDSVVVSDTVWITRGRPAVPTGLRGTQGFRVELSTGATDQHSGVCGGAARNPVGELAQLLSEMYDARTGKVKVPGFYDGVEKPSRRELEEFARSGFSIAAFRRDHMFTSLRSNDPIDVMTRIWGMPTLEVHGLVGGYTGPGIKTVIPPRAELKLSTRLVPNQDPAKIVKIFRKFVKERCPDATFSVEGTLAPYRGTSDGPYADAVRDALRFAFGKDPAFVREGGSIGAVLTMQRVLAVPITFLGLSLPEHGYHAPNEFFDWGQASGGMKAFARYFQKLGELGPIPAPRPAKKAAKQPSRPAPKRKR